MAEAKDIRSALQADFARLATARGELRVQLQLAKAEAIEEWNKLEATWLRVEEELKHTADHTREPLKDMGVAARQLIDELKAGYDRIRAQIRAGT